MVMYKSLDDAQAYLTILNENMKAITGKLWPHGDSSYSA